MLGVAVSPKDCFVEKQEWLRPASCWQALPGVRADLVATSALHLLRAAWAYLDAGTDSLMTLHRKVGIL